MQRDWHTLALAQLGGFGLLFVLGFVSFEKQEIEPFMTWILQQRGSVFPILSMMHFLH